MSGINFKDGNFIEGYTLTHRGYMTLNGQKKGFPFEEARYVVDNSVSFYNAKKLALENLNQIKKAYNHRNGQFQYIIKGASLIFNTGKEIYQVELKTGGENEDT